MKHIRFTHPPTNINETNHQEKDSRRNREVDDRRNREEEDRDRRNREEEDRDRQNREEEDRDKRIEGRNRVEEKFVFLKDYPVIKSIIIGLIILFVIYICYKLYIYFTKKTSDKQTVIIDDIKIEDSELLDINSDSETESVIDEDDVVGIDDIVIKGTKTGLPIANMRYVYF